MNLKIVVKRNPMSTEYMWTVRTEQSPNRAISGSSSTLEMAKAQARVVKSRFKNFYTVIAMDAKAKLTEEHE